MPITLKVGDTAPEFTLKDKDGKNVSLSDFNGKRVVLYFYPKDDTPGCTLQACGFRDVSVVCKKKEIVVLGVSPDSAETHAAFAEKHSLSFTLLADPQHVAATTYGVRGKKTVHGRTTFGISRATFLIDEDGKIIHIFPDVNPDNHATEVLEAFGDR